MKAPWNDAWEGMRALKVRWRTWRLYRCGEGEQREARLRELCNEMSRLDCDLVAEWAQVPLKPGERRVSVRNDMPAAQWEAFREFVETNRRRTYDEWAAHDEAEERFVGRSSRFAGYDAAARRVFQALAAAGRINRRWEWTEIDHGLDMLCILPAGGGSYVAAALAAQDLISEEDFELVVGPTWVDLGLPLPSGFSEF